MTELQTLTLFTDASYCQQTGAAGWGAWAKRTGWVLGEFHGGEFRETLLNPGEAELAAIAMALDWVRDMGALSGTSMVMVQSDNIRALQLIATSVPRAQISNHIDSATIWFKSLTASPLEKRQLDWMHGLVAAFQSIQIRVRHVRGHTNGDKRQWVNRGCDRIARRHMERDRRRRGLTASPGRLEGATLEGRA